MRIPRFLLILLLVPGFALAQDMVARDGVTLTQAQENRAEAIGDQLRCLVCQNESIEESSAGLAKQLRGIIRQQVAKGAPDKQIMDYMVKRYGIFVLLKPPVSPLTWLLYASPFVALIVGFLVFWMSRRGRGQPVAPLNEAEQARLDELLK
ncbi:cytochrome c-type biogenesis protein [Acidocella sp.]|uniref:cytochrome c-type biogenesis protein n=1 Tax=Acidocella sp. TaxID=50710 RepID=UPI003D010E65